MVSTATTRLRFEKQGFSDNPDTWGTVLNAVLDRIDEAIAGAVTISTTGGTETLTEEDYIEDQSRKAILLVSGTLASNATIEIPALTKIYAVSNATSGSFTLTVKTSAGTGAVAPQGTQSFILCDGTDCFLIGVAGPASSTDNTVPRFDGTSGQILQSSGVTIDDSNNLSGVADFTLSGTVDGRDIASDGSKLDTIESGATADQTAADIRALGFFDITNDGTGSGLDADLLDGNEASAFAQLNGDGGISLSTDDGIDINPGSDADADLLTVGVTGAPTVSWDESSDAFKANKPWIISSDGNGDITHTISGASVTSDLEIHSEGSTDLGGIAVHRHTNNNNFGGHLFFLRSDGTHAAPSAVDDNDTLGRIIGLGYDGTDYEPAAEIRFRVDGTPGNNDMPGDIAFYTNAGSQTLTERLVIGADGTITAGTGGSFRLDSSAYFQIQSSNPVVAFDSNDFFLYNRSSNLLNFSIGGSQIIQLTSSGMNMTDNLLSRPYIQDYAEVVNALGDLGGGTDNIDLTQGNVVTATVSTSTQTFTFSNPPASGRAGKFTLYLTNGGSQTVNWPASVDWPGGVAPTLTSSGVDILVFTTTNGGTTWFGNLVGADYS